MREKKPFVLCSPATNHVACPRHAITHWPTAIVLNDAKIASLNRRLLLFVNVVNFV